MKNSVKISIIIGIIIGTIFFPMVILPLIGIGVAVVAIYIFMHDLAMPYFEYLLYHRKKHRHID